MISLMLSTLQGFRLFAQAVYPPIAWIKRHSLVRLNAPISSHAQAATKNQAQALRPVPCVFLDTIWITLTKALLTQAALCVQCVLMVAMLIIREVILQTS